MSDDDEPDEFAQGTGTEHAPTPGGRGKRRMITWGGETLPADVWATRFGVGRRYVSDLVRLNGTEEAMSYLESSAARPRPRKAGIEARGEADATEVLQAIGSLTEAHREFTGGSVVSAVSQTYLAYRFLVGVLRRNKYPIS